VPVPDAQGATITFDGVTLGVCQGVTPSFRAGTVHEVTGTRSPVIGTGQNARVIKQYTCTSVEPGTFTARFLGAPDLGRSDVGRPGVLRFTSPAGSYSFQAFLIDLQPDWQRGEFVQWAAVFQISGF